MSSTNDVTLMMSCQDARSKEHGLGGMVGHSEGFGETIDQSVLQPLDNHEPTRLDCRKHNRIQESIWIV